MPTAISCCSRIRTGARWDRARIARGLACLERAGPLARAGAYQLQAAIAACHAQASSWAATDWPRIVSHYRALAALAPSPVVDLNLAVAIGLADGPAAGLAALDRIGDPALRDYHLLPAARAEFLRRLGRAPEAAVEYRRALGLVDNPREQAFLAARLAACEAAGPRAERSSPDEAGEPADEPRADRFLEALRHLAAQPESSSRSISLRARGNISVSSSSAWCSTSSLRTLALAANCSDSAPVPLSSGRTRSTTWCSSRASK